MNASSKIANIMISKYFNIHTLVCYIICAFNRFKIHSRIHCSDTVKLLKITSKCKKGILKSAFIYIKFFLICAYRCINNTYKLYFTVRIAYISSHNMMGNRKQ